MRNNIFFLSNFFTLFFIAFSVHQSYGQVTLVTTGQSRDTSATGSGIYSITSTNHLTLLHDFRIFDPTHPKEIVAGSEGMIYGISELGGSFNKGAIFAMDYHGMSFSIIHHISKEDNFTSNVFFGPDDKIYIVGGSKLYRMETDGSLLQAVATIPLSGGYTDEFTIDENGWLYGYYTDIKNGERILYRMKTDGSEFKVLHNFGQLADGDHLKLNSSAGSRVYGIYSVSDGFLYSFKQDGTDFQVEYNFSYDTYGHSVNRGRGPVFVNGKLYFSSSHAILSYDTLDANVEPLYYNAGKYFDSEPVFAESIFFNFSYDGLCSVDFNANYASINSEPGTSLIYSSVLGELYYLNSGGKYNDVSVKFITPSGSYFGSFHDFGNAPDGYGPSRLSKAPSGSIYGYTQYGGEYGAGIIYKLNKDGGDFKKIYDLNPASGDNLTGDLIIGPNNKIYGISSTKASLYTRNYSVFRIDTTGANFTLLKSFDYSTQGSIGAITISNAFIYGFVGGSPFTIFRMSLDGTDYNSLYTLNNSSQFGASPYNIASYNGYIYGNTYGGGANGRGTFFRIKNDGTGFSTIHHITDADGYEFLNGLTVASNNKIYTHSWMGGLDQAGTLVSIDPATLQFKVEYNYTNLGRGQTFPETPLFQASDHRLYCSRYGFFSSDLSGQSILDYSNNGFSAGSSPSIIEITSNNTFCDGSPAYFICPINGDNYFYQWQVNTGSGFVNLNDNAVYNGVYNSTLNIAALTSELNNYQYRCEVSKGDNIVYSSIFYSKIQNSWSGAVSNSWTNPLNWYCGKVPDANTNVYIPLGITNYPVITTPVICKTLVVQKGASLTVAPGGDLKVLK